MNMDKKRRILISTLILVFLIISIISVYFLFFYNDYSRGELELKTELINGENLNQHSNITIECSLENKGENDLRIIPFRLQVRIFDINEEQIPKIRGLSDGAPVYSNSDLIILKSGSIITKSIQISLFEYDINQTGEYTLKLRYFSKDYIDNVSLSFWEGFVESEDITLNINNI